MFGCIIAIIAMVSCAKCPGRSSAATSEVAPGYGAVADTGSAWSIPDIESVRLAHDDGGVKKRNSEGTSRISRASLEGSSRGMTEWR